MKTKYPLLSTAVVALLVSFPLTMHAETEGAQPSKKAREGGEPADTSNRSEGVKSSTSKESSSLKEPATSAKKAREGGEPMKEISGSVSTSDNEFIMKAAQGGMLDVEAGTLAASKGASADVKEFGQMMATDHGKVNGQLKSLAASKGINLPDELDARHQEKHDQLAKLSGQEFDKTYLKETVKAHEKTVSLFEGASRSEDSDVKAFATKTLPALNSHLEKAKALHSTHAK